MKEGVCSTELTLESKEWLALKLLSCHCLAAAEVRAHSETHMFTKASALTSRGRQVVMLMELQAPIGQLW